MSDRVYLEITSNRPIYNPPIMHFINLKAPLYNNTKRLSNPINHQIVTTNVWHHHTFIRRKLIIEETITIDIKTITLNIKIFQINLNQVQDTIQTIEKLSTWNWIVKDCFIRGEGNYGKLKEGDTIAKRY